MINPKITRLPDALNPNEMMRNVIHEKYGTKCPVCGETKSDLDYLKNGVTNKGIIAISSCKTWYGKAEHKSILKKFTSKKRNWQINCYRCNTCGCAWESPEFPTDLVDSHVLQQFEAILDS